MFNEDMMVEQRFQKKQKGMIEDYQRQEGQVSKELGMYYISKTLYFDL